MTKLLTLTQQSANHSVGRSSAMALEFAVGLGYGSPDAIASRPSIISVHGGIQAALKFRGGSPSMNGCVNDRGDRVALLNGAQPDGLDMKQRSGRYRCTRTVLKQR